MLNGEIFDDICNQFNEKLNGCLELDENNSRNDGRLSSLINEDKVIDFIKSNINIHRVQFLTDGNNRSFGDLDVVIQGTMFPVNVKMSNRKSNSNSATTKHLIYMLSGKLSYGHNKLVNTLIDIKNEKILAENGKDYVYFHYDKYSGNLNWYEFGQIPENNITVNPTNGIQIIFNEIEKIDRCKKKRMEFIFDLCVSWEKKRAEPYIKLLNNNII